jgi:hypothetical protein
MFQFYAAGMANATDPFEVGRIILHAIETDQPELRYPVSWAGAELAARHDRIADQDWLDLGRVDDDEEYADLFERVFGVDIRLG